MGNPIQSIPDLPPAIALSGAEQFWINQAGVDKRTSLAAALTGGVTGGGAPSVPDYATLRASIFPDSVTSVLLYDPYKGGVFVRGPSTLPDNGGTRILDSGGQMWWRVYDERINAAWFYSAPPDVNGNPTTLGSGAAQITQAELDANVRVWVGLADDGGTGVQIAQPYPVGTYWDFVALQEWIYACAGERSQPQSTFMGSMQNDGRVRISQWLTGPHSLSPGQPITGAGVAPGTVVTAVEPTDPDVYWVATNPDWTTTGLNITTDRGTFFRGWNGSGAPLTASGSTFTGPPLQPGDELLSPTFPPAPTHYDGVQPGTVVGPQISGPAGGGPGVVATFNFGVKQTVPETTMTGVGGPTWNTVNGETWRNQPGFCPRGVMNLNQMLVVNGDGLDLLFASKLGTNLMWHGNATGTSNVGPGLKFNTLAFSTVKSLAVTDVSVGGATNYVVSLSHTSGALGLNVENNTLQDWSIGGNYSTTKCGVAVSPEGGAAQGDTQTFIACWVTGCDDGFTFGGANAIAGTFFGGQTQSCPRYGVGAFLGSFSTYTMLTENMAAVTYYQTPQRTQVHLGGADFYAQQVSTESCLSIGTRSEGVIGMIDFSHESSMMNWTSGGFFPKWAANSHWTPQTMLSVTNPVANYGVVMIANDGGPPWMLSDANTTTTVISFTPSPGWTPNQWAGFGIWMLSGRNSVSNTIVSNTDHTLTLVTPYAGITPQAPARWFKIFALSGGAAPNWGAVTHFGQFTRNAVGRGATIAKGFNLVAANAAPLVAGDWIMLPNMAVFPDGAGVSMALSGQVQNQHPASSGWYIQTFGDTATIWGVPTNPILLGGLPNATSFNFLIAQLGGTPSGVGQYQLAFSQTLGADFTGSISGAFLTVTAVNAGTLGSGLYLGGAGISPSAPPQITSAGTGFTGFLDDGSGGITAGTVLTVQAVTAGVVRPGAPVTGGGVAAGTVILSQISGPAGGAGTYNVSGFPQLIAQCSFTGSMSTLALLTVSAVASGKLVAGQLLQGVGVAPNTVVGSQVSGATGGPGVYNINVPQNIASEAMTAKWTLAGGGMAAQFTAHVDDGASGLGNILTVTAVAFGVLGIGQTVNVPVTGGPAGLTQLATIIQGLNDTGTGGVGTYTLAGLGAGVIVASQAMTSNTTGGIGVYALNQTLGSPIASEPMLAGRIASISALWEIVDNLGGPVNSTQYSVDGFGYWSAGIPDGGLTQMVIDFDVMWGVGALDQCQLQNFGKVGSIGRMDNIGLPGGLTGQAIRPQEGSSGQFSYKSAAQFTTQPRFNVSATSSPYTISQDNFNQSNVNVTVTNDNTVLGLALLGPGLVVDIDLFLTPGANIVGGMTVQWDPATVKAAAPTINIGQGGQKTIVRLKWVGNGQTATPGGSWWIMSTQGPM